MSTCAQCGEEIPGLVGIDNWCADCEERRIREEMQTVSERMADSCPHGCVKHTPGEWRNDNPHA